MSEETHELKLFVGGLAQETTRDQLQTYFETYGRIKEALVMVDGASRRSRGFGFVTFESCPSFQTILEMEHIIDGRKVDVKRACPKLNNPKSSSNQHNHSYRTDKIFVGGLPDITTDEFRQYFEKFGNVVDAVLMTEKASGRLRGFGFVTFEKPQSVEDVMKQFNDHYLKGKWVECKRATPKDAQHRQHLVMNHSHRDWSRNQMYGGPPPPEDFRDYAYYDPYAYAYEPPSRSHRPLTYDPFAHPMRMPYPGPDPYATMEQRAPIYAPIPNAMSPVPSYGHAQQYPGTSHYHQYQLGGAMPYAPRSYAASPSATQENSNHGPKYGPTRLSSTCQRSYPY